MQENKFNTTLSAETKTIIQKGQCCQIWQGKSKCISSFKLKKNSSFLLHPLTHYAADPHFSSRDPHMVSSWNLHQRCHLTYDYDWLCHGLAYMVDVYLVNLKHWFLILSKNNNSNISNNNSNYIKSPLNFIYQNGSLVKVSTSFHMYYLRNKSDNSPLVSAFWVSFLVSSLNMDRRCLW